jgi:hypothetical protein
MTVPPSVPPTTSAPTPSLLRSAVWVAIGALIAAAIVCVVWVLIGPQNAIIGRAFLTILLLAAFAGVAIMDAHFAPRRAPWYVLASMLGWVLALLVGAFKIWLPMQDGLWSWDNGFVRFFEFVGVVLVIRLALLHIVLYVRAHQRHVTTFTRILTIVTIVLVSLLALMLIVPLTFPREFTYSELYWRVVVAVTILAAVGTALIPLINALNSPRVAKQPPLPYAAPPVPAAGPQTPQAPQWPTYVDGVTPLPVLPDGTPDWNAYYTGYPSPGAHLVAPPPTAVYPPVQAPQVGTQPGYPPVPPLPPQPPVP